MIIKRKSVFSGVERARDIPVNPEDYKMWEQGFSSIDDAMPYLNSDDREFILSGMTDQEWKNAFSEEILNIVSDTFA